MTPGVADLTADELSQALGPLLGPLGGTITKAVQNYPGEPGEVVSHDVTRIDRHIVVTFLVRQGKP